MVLVCIQRTANRKADYTDFEGLKVSQALQRAELLELRFLHSVRQNRATILQTSDLPAMKEICQTYTSGTMVKLRNRILYIIKTKSAYTYRMDVYDNLQIV